MWLFTTYGFFSVTASTYEPGMIQVRARSAQHLLNLKNEQLIDRQTELVSTPDADYAWRIMLTPDQWAHLLALLGNEVQHYPNFKNECGARGMLGRRFTKLLHQLWSALLGYQREVNPPGDPTLRLPHREHPEGCLCPRCSYLPEL